MDALFMGLTPSTCFSHGYFYQPIDFPFFLNDNSSLF